MRTSPRKLGVIAGLLILVGVVVVATAPEQNFCWLAFEPVSEAFGDPPLRFSPAGLSGRQLLGFVAVGAGLVLAGLAVGVRLGRRQTR